MKITTLRALSALLLISVTATTLATNPLSASVANVQVTLGSVSFASTNAGVLAGLPDGTVLTGAQIAALPTSWTHSFLSDLPTSEVMILPGIIYTNSRYNSEYNSPGFSFTQTGATFAARGNSYVATVTYTEQSGYPSSYYNNNTTPATVQIVMTETAVFNSGVVTITASAPSVTFADSSLAKVTTTTPSYSRYSQAVVNKYAPVTFPGLAESSNFAYGTTQYSALKAALGTAASGTLTAAQIALLPKYMQDSISEIIACNQSTPGFTSSVSFTYSNNMYTFNMSYVETVTSITDLVNLQSDSGSGHFSWLHSITGGPPPTVCYGSPFSVDITLQAWCCQNSNLVLMAGTTSPSSGTATGGIIQQKTIRDVAYGRGGEGGAYDIYQDEHLGDFIAPLATDKVQNVTLTSLNWSNKSLGGWGTSPDPEFDANNPISSTVSQSNTTYAASPQFKVDSIFRLEQEAHTGLYGETDRGDWNVNLVSMSASSTLTASSGGTTLTTTGTPPAVTVSNNNDVVITSTITTVGNDTITLNEITGTSTLPNLPDNGSGSTVNYTLPAGTTPGTYTFQNYIGTTGTPPGNNPSNSLTVVLTGGTGPGVTQPGSSLITVQAAAKPASEYRSWFSNSKPVDVQVKVPEKQ